MINTTVTSASLIKQDATTKGNWIGVYGSQGYNVIGDTPLNPTYATITPVGQSTFTWASSTTDTRALQNPGGSGRIAAAWYSSTSFTIDVNVTDGHLHALELYLLDYVNAGRVETVTLSSATTAPSSTPRTSRTSETDSTSSGRFRATS